MSAAGNSQTPTSAAKPTVARNSIPGKDFTEIQQGSQFEAQLRELLRRTRPRHIIETGTYLGKGTTRIIASAIKDFGFSETIFNSIECNPEHHRLALQNLAQLGLRALVRPLLGLSVPRSLLPSADMVRQKTIAEADGTNVFVDHQESQRVELYLRETDFPDAAEDLLGACLDACANQPDLVLLDSGGHMGNVEFNYVISRLRGPCYVVLDDVHHIKHARSLQQMKADLRFQILSELDEKFGACFAKFHPVPRTNGGPLDGASRVLFVCTGSIGNAVLASSMLEPLWRHYPNARLAVLCHQPAAELFTACPFVDSIICYDAVTIADPAERQQIMAEITTFQPDAVLNAACSPDIFSKELAHAFPEARHLATDDSLIAANPDTHPSALSRHEEFLNGLGIETLDLQPVVWTAPEDEALAGAFFQQQGLDPAQTIAIFPGGQATAQAGALGRLAGFRFLIFGVAAHAGEAAVLEQQLPGRTINLCKRTTLRETAALLRRCRRYLGTEATEAPIARAVGVTHLDLADDRQQIAGLSTGNGSPISTTPAPAVSDVAQLIENAAASVIAQLRLIKANLPAGRKLTGILLAEHFGDLVACEPVIPWLRENNPADFIVWLTKPAGLELLKHHPGLDAVLAVDSISVCGAVIRSGVLDTVVDLHLHRKPCTVFGVKHNKLWGNPAIDTESYYHHGTLLEALGGGAGLPRFDGQPRVFLPAETEQTVAALQLPTKFVVFHTRSNESTRNWHDARWNELADLLVSRFGLTVVEVGLVPVLAANRRGVINLCGKLCLVETAAVIRRAAHYFGVDSGPAHFANACEIPSVILLGHYRDFPRYMPYTGFLRNHAEQMVIQWQGPASDIPVAEVLRRFELGQPAGHHSPASKLTITPGIQTPDNAANETLAVPAAETLSARLIAFYLPQFHPIPENDRWWGRGFTEWVNVAKAKPRFPEHYQPRLPGELGFYDLRLAEVRTEQASLARAHGIEGFCYWHYWFNGKRLLERPVNDLLASGQPDFPFCLAWANENWTRRWDGNDREMLQAQTYGGEADDRAHFESLLPAFADARAIRVAGRPLFLVYRPASLPDAPAMIRLWRELAAQAGLPGLYLVAMRTCFDGQDRDWRQAGFDGELYFQPDFSDKMQRLANTVGPTRDRVVEYAHAWRAMSAGAESLVAQRGVFPSVVPSWDNSARRKEASFIFHGSTPAEYGRWLRKEINAVRPRSQDERLVFINAWNEWAEGNHLEPDQLWGRAYLEETRRAITGQPGQPTTLPLINAAIVPHPAPPAPIHEPTDALQKRAESLRRIANWAEAGEIYKILTNRLPDDLAVWAGRLDCSRQQGHQVLANLILAEALEMHPEWKTKLAGPAKRASAAPVSRLPV